METVRVDLACSYSVNAHRPLTSVPERAPEVIPPVVVTAEVREQAREKRFPLANMATKRKV